MNYSFWADEAYIAGIAQLLLLGKITLLRAFDLLPYQRLYILLITLFFKIFGANEFVARLPSLLFFLVGSIAIFFLAKKLSNVFGAILSSFLYGFSHLNLAYATQVKPYAALESITLIVILLICVMEEMSPRKRIVAHISIITLIIIATFLHTLGVLLWILYLVTLVRKVKFSFVTVLALVTVFIALPFIIPRLFLYNNFYQVAKLFIYKYTFILIPALFGFVEFWKKNKRVGSALLTYSCLVLFLATFQQYIFNIRYVLSLFGIMFVFFGTFWATLGERIYPQRKWLIPLIIIAALYCTSYKIVRSPQNYYNPNIDKYGDIQIANYKELFQFLKKQPNLSRSALLSDLADPQLWYLPEHFPDATFVKPSWNNIGYGKQVENTVTGKPVYTTLGQFKATVKQNKSGYIIVEDWQSFLPDDIKAYVKKNFKLQFRVESLAEAPNDPWPLALYSWGIK